MEPITPAMFLRGRTAKKLNRIREAATNPLDAKSASFGDMISSNPGTDSWSCVLTPHTRKSPWEGISRKISAGRFFYLAVGLRPWRQDDVTFLHGLHFPLLLSPGNTLVLARR